MPFHDDGRLVFLTTAEVAERWGMSPRTLEGWRDKGIGPTWRRLGTQTIRYHIDDVVRFEELWCSSDVNAPT